MEKKYQVFVSSPFHLSISMTLENGLSAQILVCRQSLLSTLFEPDY